MFKMSSACLNAGPKILMPLFDRFINACNFVRMRSDLAFLSYIIKRITFSGHSVHVGGLILYHGFFLLSFFLSFSFSKSDLRAY